jgi:hypothetical protein
LALPEDEANQYFDPVFPGAHVPAAPGTVNGATVHLTPGRWLYAYFLAVDTTEMGVPGDGPRTPCRGWSASSPSS